MSAIACCHEGCGASVCFTPEIEQRLRRTHETWMCPFGHRQSFIQKTDEEKRLAHAEDMKKMWMDLAHNYEKAFGTCPFCGARSYAHFSRRWMYLLRHMVKAHPDIIPPRALMAFYKARKEAA